MTERMVPRSHAHDIAEACSELADKALSWKDRALAAEEALRKFASEVYTTPTPDKLDAATIERAYIAGFDQGWEYREIDTPEGVAKRYARAYAHEAVATDPHQHGGKGA